MTSTSFSNFLEALGAFESGINPNQDYGTNDLDWLQLFDPDKGNVDRNSVDLTDNNDLSELQYHVHNTIGFLGKYQFGEPLLIDLGYYTPGPGGFYGQTSSNEWQGTFTGKHGVYSKEDFMSNVQELAIREAFAMNMTVIDRYLSQAGKTVDDYLGQEFTYTRFGVEHTATVSMSGILASAHLQGPGGVANLLIRNTASSDEYGTNILFYMDQFGGFQTPFGTTGDETLSGSDYGETFAGEAGHNIYETGGGFDKIIIAENPNGSDTIKDFQIGNDVISLAAVGNVHFSELNISDDGNGNTRIILPNQQVITLEGVAANQITESDFVYGPYQLGWQAGAGDIIFDNFNAQHDLIDFNYAFTVDAIDVYEENGSTVIDIVNNNQRYVFEGTPLAEISMANFVKMPIGFADLFFAASPRDPAPPADNPPPVNNDNTDDNNTDNSNDNSNSEPFGNGNMYSYTWNWGKQDVINDFDAGQDVVNLQSFWTSYDNFDIYNNNEGHAVIDLNDINNQTITLQGVSVEQLTAQNFSGVSGSFANALGEGTGTVDTGTDTGDSTTDNSNPTSDSSNNTTDDDTTDQTGDSGTSTDNSGDGQVYAYTWSWGSENIIAHFDTTKDSVDLGSFWTSYNDFDIFEDQAGNIVIDLSNLNNQIITLQGVNLDSLSADNIKGVQGNYTDALTTASTPVDPVDVDDTSNADTNTGINDTNILNAKDGDDLQGSAMSADVFKFTWQWGSEHIVENFDTAQDSIDLKSFWTSPDNVSVYNDANGNAVIDLKELNNQTITLVGVNSDSLTDDNLLI